MIGRHRVFVAANADALDYLELLPPPQVADWGLTGTFWTWTAPDHWAIKAVNDPGNYAALLQLSAGIGLTPPPHPSWRVTFDAAFDIPGVIIAPTLTVVTTNGSAQAPAAPTQTGQVGRVTYEFAFPETTVPAGGTFLRADLATTFTYPAGTFVAGTTRLYNGTVGAVPATGNTTDISCLVDRVSIQHGRDDTTGQPAPASATIELTPHGPNGETLPAWVDVGTVVTVDTIVASTTYRRFTGRFTDLTFAWDDLGPDTATAGSVSQIVAVSRLADLSRRVIGDEVWPQEHEYARIERIGKLAGVEVAADYVGGVRVLPLDVDARPALELMQETAESARGIIWHTRGGRIAYANVNHRSSTTPLVTYDACDLLLSPTWTRTNDGLINYASIGYGPTPDEGEQPRLIGTDTQSVAQWGRYEYSYTTQLALLADAQLFLDATLGRNARPAWVFNGVSLDMEGLTDAETRTTLALEVGDLIGLQNLPATVTTPTEAAFWVEGWSEELAYGYHLIELAVSDYARFAPPTTWDNVPPGETWNTTDPTHTWNSYIAEPVLPAKDPATTT